MQKLHNNKYNIVICGDVNYLIDNNRRSQLDAVLHSYNLAGIAEFPTRFGLNSQTAINNVFIDISTIGSYELYPFINGLSDHDDQLLILTLILRRSRTGTVWFYTSTQESSTTKTVHKVINKGLKAYV